MRLLVLEDNADFAETLVSGLTLRDETYSIHRVSRLEEATKLLRSESFDAAIIDLTLPDAQGCEAARALREADSSLALVAMSGLPFDAVARELTTIGVQDFLQKGTVDFERVHQVLQLASIRHRQQIDLQEHACTDPLTGVMNRLKAADQIEKAINHANRTGFKASVFVIDVDDFKMINDQFGHPAGDNLLRDLVDTIGSVLRAGDSMGRLGGDEFVVILEGIGSHLDAASVASKISRAVSESSALGVYERSMSVSIGIAVVPDDGGSVEGLLERADKALYRAKKAGKNTYAFYSSVGETARLLSRLS
jgi:diguanylate cyclase (GGDEF)-like protein